MRELSVRLPTKEVLARRRPARRAWSTTYLAEAERVGAPIVAVFETHVQADHVSGLPALVEATGATRVSPGRRRCRVRPRAAGRRARSSSSATRSCGRWRRRVMRPPITPTSSPIAAAATRSRGLFSRATRCSSVTSAGPTCTRRVIRSRLHGCSSRRCSACSSCPTVCSSTRATTAARSAAARSPATRSRRSGSSGRTTRRSHTPTPTSFARALLVDVPPPPVGQAAIVAANRAGRSRAGVTAGPFRLGLRANARQFALLVALNALCRGDGRTRAQRAAARRRARLRPRLDRRDPLASSSLSGSRRRSRTSPPAVSPTASAASGCSSSAGCSRCRCRC